MKPSKAIEELIEEINWKRKQAYDSWQECKKLGPNLYGVGRELGVWETCDEILEIIKGLCQKE